MADFTLTLTGEETMLLTHWLEQRNAQRAQERDEEGQPVPPWTTTDLLHWAVRNDLQNRLTELRADTAELAQILRGLGAAARTAVLAQMPDGARKTFLQARVTQGL